MMRALFRRLRRDQRGMTVIEFAVVAPVLFILLMGLCDLAYQSYIQAILTGEMQKAGRDSTIQGAITKTNDLDARVKSQVSRVAKNATFAPTRSNYASFSKMKPEFFFDDNSNGQFDSATECFIDINNSNGWDRDPGTTGQGGANDVTLYTMEVSYARLFPLSGLMGWSNTVKIAASTVLKNQPYAQQNVHAERKICP